MRQLTETEKYNLYKLVETKVYFFSYLAQSLEKSDLTHEVYIKLLPYLERNYDPSRSNLETFVEFKVKKYLIDISDNFHYGTTYNKNKIRKLEKAKSDLKNSNLPITWEKIRKKAGLSKKQADSIYYPFYFSPASSDIVLDDLVFSLDTGVDAMEREEKIKELYVKMEEVLSPDQYQVIVKKYIEDKAYPLIAEELNLPTSKIHSLSISAKRKLKKSVVYSLLSP